MTTQSKWLPCPFCGGTKLRSGGDDKTVMVWCVDCEATGPNGYAGKAEWNTRAPAQGDSDGGLNGK